MKTRGGKTVFYLVPICWRERSMFWGWIDGEARTECAKCPWGVLRANPNQKREAAEEYWGRSQNQGHKAPENWGQSPIRGRSPRLSGEGSGDRAPPQKIFENSHLKLCNLVYSWSENLTSPCGGSRNWWIRFQSQLIFSYVHLGEL